jgi:DNA-directed RNA polymerase subunit L
MYIFDPYKSTHDILAHIRLYYTTYYFTIDAKKALKRFICEGGKLCKAVRKDFVEKS